MWYAANRERLRDENLKKYRENSELAKAKARTFYQENRQRLIERSQQYYRSNIQKKKEYDQTRHKKNPKLRRQTELRRKYGMTVEEFDALLGAQENQCACCRELLVQPAVDHCHKTGRVRGLLCGPCNRALGHAREDKERCLRLAAYLEANTCCVAGKVYSL